MSAKLIVGLKIAEYTLSEQKVHANDVWHLFNINISYYNFQFTKLLLKLNDKVS